MADSRVSRLLKILGGAVADEDLVYPPEGRLERWAHFAALVVRHFIRHRCFVRASALSYSTLLALIPLLVVALSVTSGLLKNQDEEELSRFVERIVSSVAPSASLPATSPSAGSSDNLSETTNSGTGTNAAGGLATVATNDIAGAVAPPAPHPVMTPNIQKEVARWIHQFVQKTSSGALGVTGMVVLIFTAISLLRGIEETFNDIWGVRRGRSWLLQIMLYWTILSLGPLLLGVALGLLGSLHWSSSNSWLESSPLFAPILNHLLPIAVMSLLMAFFYKLTPNTRVEFGSALAGGLFAGTVWHAYNQLGFLLTSRAVSTSLTYGGLALVVLVMGGLYIVWVIVLLGAEISYASQNRAAYLQDRLAENVNQRGREFVAVRIMTCLAKRYQSGLPPQTVLQISSELGVPNRLTQSILSALASNRLVTEVAGLEPAFVPARPLDTINAHHILQAVRSGKGREVDIPNQSELLEIYGEFSRIEDAERQAATGLTLHALANPRPLSLPSPATAGLPPPAGQSEKNAPFEKATLKPAQPAPAAIPKPAPAPDSLETSRPPPPAEPPRRKPSLPDETTDFPL